MARQNLPIGTYGAIRISKNSAGTTIAITRFRGNDGIVRKASRTGRTKNAATLNLKAYLAEVLRSEDTGLADQKLPAMVEEWWTEYVETGKPSTGTKRRYRGVIDNHILKKLGGFTVREAKTPRVNAFLRSLVKETSAATGSIAKAILQNVFNYAIRMGAISVNPVDGCAPIKSEVAQPRAWTIEEISDMRTKLRQWDAGVDRRGMARVSDLAEPSDFMLGTGCRPGETFAVRWDDINFETSPATVRIHATVVKDELFKTVIQEHTKTNRVRILALPPFVVAMLLNRRMESTTEVVFPSSTETVRNPDNFRLQWKEALGEGLETFNELPKMFRSSVGSFIALEHGADAARGQLGHSTVTTTENHYIAKVDTAKDLTATFERVIQSGVKMDSRATSATVDGSGSQ
ncbi:tyrosine-type recombinase/integrase [Leucobacter musarum]|uniref:tyrosine-type recombinase/integrase n=1 Tax=Leucobacter musarum TaxID=1930747 RepID=UPI0006A77191|nr:site-specific integrase [Leucobacter musarum]